MFVVGRVDPTDRHHCFHPEYPDTELIVMGLAEVRTEAFVKAL